MGSKFLFPACCTKIAHELTRFKQLWVHRNITYAISIFQLERDLHDPTVTGIPKTCNLRLCPWAGVPSRCSPELGTQVFSPFGKFDQGPVAVQTHHIHSGRVALATDLPNMFHEILFLVQMVVSWIATRLFGKKAKV